MTKWVKQQMGRVPSRAIGMIGALIATTYLILDARIGYLVGLVIVLLKDLPWWKAVPYGPHTVNRLQLRREWPYKVQKKYNCDWMHQPKAGSNPARVIKACDGCIVVAFHEVKAVTLYAGYAWDGNSGPAVNTLKCLRASALHDAWCQAMGEDIFKNNFRNWAAGASEYQRICRKDNMGRLRAKCRYLVILGYGCWKKFTGRLRPVAPRP